MGVLYTTRTCPDGAPKLDKEVRGAGGDGGVLNKVLRRR
jgi:hypothetical protein